ncbi:MAG: hypothetical protein AB8F95_02495 [Bacteroidia bacterium]
MYRSYLKDKFPHDERNGLYVAPNMPAVKLGKALMKDRRIASPNDVLALHVDDGTFSSNYIIFTHDKCYYDGGEFLLEDVKEIQLEGKKLTVFANQKGQYLPHQLKAKNETVAKTLQRVFDGLGSFDPKAQELVANAYENYSTTELDWLNLRDEVMRTIDMLHDRFQEGKLSLVQYEEKKLQLLERL